MKPPMPTAAAPILAPAPRDVQMTRPDPPRYCWLKRLTLGTLLLVVALLAVRLAWGWEAERRFARAIAPVLARGEPTTAAQWNPLPVAEPVNATPYLRKAAAAVNTTAWSPANTSINFPAAYTPHSPGWHTVAAQSVAANGAVFPLARQARAHDRFDWGTRAASPVAGILLRYLNDTRMLANTLGDAAQYAHEQGDDVAALETMRDVLHVAKAARTDGFTVCALVGVGIDSLACARLMEIAPGLRLDPDAPPPPTAPDATTAAAGRFPTTAPLDRPRPVSPAHVRAVIDELLDDRDSVAGMRRALAGERVTQLDLADWLGRGSWVLRPMLRLDAVRMLEADEEITEAAAQTNQPAARVVLARLDAKLPPPLPPGRRVLSPTAPGAAGARREPIDFARLLSNDFLNGASSGRIVIQHLRGVTERRMTAVSLAAQLYRAEHDEWPPTIEALVPKYLPEVPTDPLAAEGERLRYILVPGGLPDGRDRPVVYSAGDNGVYETDDARILPAAPVYFWRRSADEWRDLSRWAPPPPASGPAR